MKFSAALVALYFLAGGVQAHQLPSRYALARRGNQFVTGPCDRDSDCQQGCCAFSTGKCAGPGIAQSRDGGCGFGNAKPNCNVAKALKLDVCAHGAESNDVSDPAVQKAAEFTAKLDKLPFTPTKSSPAKPAKSSPAKPATGKAGKGAAAPSASPATSGKTVAAASQKTVFETCSSDSECQQGCCGFSTGKCAGPGIAQSNGSGGCGRGDAKPNCNVAKALALDACAPGAESDGVADPAVQTAAEFTAKLDHLPFTPAKSSPAKPATSSPAKPAPAKAGKSAAAPSSASPATSGKSVTQLAASQKSKKTVFEMCASDSECQQGCCGFSTGKCAGPAVAQTNGSGGCGRGASSANCNVSTLLGFGCIKGATKDNLKDATVQAAAAFTAQLDGLTFTPS